jgi:hypothetical protein
LGKIILARTHKVRAFVGMIEKFMKKRRCLSHKRYVSHRMQQLQNEIFHEAISTGHVNLEKRQQLLKYKQHLKNL